MTTSASDSVQDAPIPTEEWFLGALQSDSPPVAELLAALEAVARAGNAGQADNWAELLDESLGGQLAEADVFRLWRLRVGCRPVDAAFRAACVKRLTDAYRRSLAGRKFVTAAGFEGDTPLETCFERMDLLLRLTPGVLCVDKTWGLGEVKRVDDFYERIALDFPGKRAHEMSFVYAAASLQLAAADHILAVQYREPARYEALVRNEPAEIVRMALRSYGRVTAGRLQELLEKSLPAGVTWKTFWDQARGALRKDPRVVIPARRTDPIQWLEEGRAAHDAWLEELAVEKDPERILTRLEEMEGRGAPEQLSPEARRQVGERLAMVVKGWGDKHPGLLARTLLAAPRWGVDASQVDVARLMPRLLDAHALRLAVEEVPTRAVGRLLTELAARDRAKTIQGLLHELGHMSFPAMQATLDFLCEAGETDVARARVRELYGMRQATTSLLLWLARRLDVLDTWVGGSHQDLLYQILTILERRHSGTYLRAANLLEELLLQKEWLATVAVTLTHAQRVSLVRYLRDGAGRIGVDTQAVIAKLVLLHPELGESLRTGPVEPSADARQAVTSWRTYRDRQRALVKLINEEIPKNSRDIGVARSYGDLRENFEYKAAKEQQAILLRRKDELDAALRTVQGTDFTGVATDAVGMGTTVEVRFPGGDLQRFHVLGEWDQDPALGIISCSSRVGQLLAGRHAGDAVELPTGDGMAACRVETVGALPEDIRQWLRGEGPLV